MCRKWVGQSLLHAGDVADLIWLLAVEHSYALVESIQQAHGILGYFRFRDDMLVIVDSDNELYNTFLNGMFSRAGKIGYLVKVEYIDTVVPFLNVTVSVDLIRRRYGTALHTKDSDLSNVPLDNRSAQAWHVHGVWPRAQLNVARHIEGSGKTAAARMVNKFHASCLPPPAIATQVLVNHSILEQPASTQKVVAKAIWVPLPYHPLIAKVISKELDCIGKDPDIRQKWKACFRQDMPPLRAAWKNSGPHHEAGVRRLKKRKLAHVPRTGFWENGSGEDGQ